MRRLELTPWARTGLAAAGIERDALEARIPQGWFVNGHATSAAGEYIFEAIHTDGRKHHASAWRVHLVPDAIESLMSMIAEDDLEDRLRASLVSRGLA